jgi:hypothetical protein
MSLLRTLGLLIFLTSSLSPAAGQHNHGSGHHDYMTWASKKTGNCCDNQDCGSLSKDEWRETAEGTEVKILGAWCPVLQEHFIIRGKSPDWTKAHACVNKNMSLSMTVCQRLLCFAGLPQF